MQSDKSKEVKPRTPLSLEIPKMADDDKAQGTPAKATRSKQGAKQKRTKDNSLSRFITESDILIFIRYCTRFSAY